MDINFDELILREAVPEDAKKVSTLIKDAMEHYH